MLQAATIDVLARTIKAAIPDFHSVLPEKNRHQRFCTLSLADGVADWPDKLFDGLMVFVIISYPLDRLRT
jgi:hypothetical protein